MSARKQAEEEGGRQTSRRGADSQLPPLFLPPPTCVCVCASLVAFTLFARWLHARRSPAAHHASQLTWLDKTCETQNPTSSLHCSTNGIECEQMDAFCENRRERAAWLFVWLCVCCQSQSYREHQSALTEPTRIAHDAPCASRSKRTIEFAAWLVRALPFDLLLLPHLFSRNVHICGYPPPFGILTKVRLFSLKVPPLQRVGLFKRRPSKSESCAALSPPALCCVIGSRIACFYMHVEGSLPFSHLRDFLSPVWRI